MATKLEVTKEDIAKATTPHYLPEDAFKARKLIRKQVAREKLRMAISELPGSRYKEILLFMMDEGLV